MKFIFFFILFLTTALGFAQTQTLRGRIVDKQTQFPLIGANVVLLNSDPLIGAATDVEGYYVLENVPLGRQSLKITYIGYEEQILGNLIVTAGKQVVANGSLEEKIMNEVVILATDEKTETINEFAVVSARGFTIEETSRYAGALNDPSRMAQNYAGVGTASDSRNDIIIRGNSPAGLLWRVEGVDIFNPNHFGSLGSTGGPVSMINYNVLANSDFITGAFPAEYGNATSGVFDLKMRNGNNSKREYTAQVGFNGFEAGAEGYFSKQSKASYLVNVRYSTLAFFKAIGFNMGTGSAVPYYQDINFKLNFPTKKAGQFSVFGIGGTSRIDLLGSEEKVGSSNLYGQSNDDIRVKAGMGVLGASHLYFFNKNLSNELRLAVTGMNSVNKIDSLVRDFTSGEVQKIIYRGSNNYYQYKYTLREQINYKLSAKSNLSAGFFAEYMQINLADSFLNGGVFHKYTDINENTMLFRTYTQFAHRFNDKLSINLGLHHLYFALNKHQAIEPRASIKYQATEKQTLSFGYGLHNQIQPLQTYFNRAESDGKLYNKDLDFFKSHHFVLAYNYLFAPEWRLRVEAYSQFLSGVAIEEKSSSFSMINSGADFSVFTPDKLVNKGTGRNVGLEFTLEKFFSKQYYLLSTLSIFDSKYTASDNIERNTAFNGNFVMNLLGGKEWKIGKKNTLGVDMRVTYAGGRRYTAIDLEKTKQNGYETRDNANAYANQLDAYKRLDLKVSFRMNGKKTTQEWQLTLQNLTNNKNVFGQKYDQATQSIVTNYQLGFFPMMNYRFTF